MLWLTSVHIYLEIRSCYSDEEHLSSTCYYISLQWLLLEKSTDEQSELLLNKVLRNDIFRPISQNDGHKEFKSSVKLCKAGNILQQWLTLPKSPKNVLKKPF